MKISVSVVAFFLSTSLHAEWRLVHTDADQAQFFIDPSNVTLVDGYKRSWVLHNLPKANAQGARSYRSVEEFDCVERAGRLMQIAAFDAEMGAGNVLGRRHGSGQWIKTQPGSVDELIMEASCKDQP